ncbi:MAG: hypothetical protein WDN46_17455 [Methylocella sp.]
MSRGDSKSQERYSSEEYIALEEAFNCWWADNSSALHLGACGDLESLRDALVAAWPNSSIGDGGAP